MKRLKIGIYAFAAACVFAARQSVADSDDAPADSTVKYEFVYKAPSSADEAPAPPIVGFLTITPQGAHVQSNALKEGESQSDGMQVPDSTEKAYVIGAKGFFAAADGSPEPGSGFPCENKVIQAPQGSWPPDLKVRVSFAYRAETKVLSCTTDTYR